VGACSTSMMSVARSLPVWFAYSRVSARPGVRVRSASSVVVSESSWCPSRLNSSSPGRTWAEYRADPGSTRCTSSPWGEASRSARLVSESTGVASCHRMDLTASGLDAAVRGRHGRKSAGRTICNADALSSPSSTTAPLPSARGARQRATVLVRIAFKPPVLPADA
jgi:hypothetical protein